MSFFNSNYMNKLDFNFIVGVSSIISELSQFPNDVADFIGCQFALESDFGRSPLAVGNENYCGMRNPSIRISTSHHAGDSSFVWACYSDLYSCVIDYLLCLQFHKPTSKDYLSVIGFSNFISQFYCPEKDYVIRIHTIYQHFKSFKS